MAGYGGQRWHRWLSLEVMWVVAGDDKGGKGGYRRWLRWWSSEVARWWPEMAGWWSEVAEVVVGGGRGGGNGG